MDMHLDFMTPEVWDGLVLGVTFIGMALAALQLYSNYTQCKRLAARDAMQRSRDRRRDESYLDNLEDD
jgi:hypothetical protein